MIFILLTDRLYFFAVLPVGQKINLVSPNIDALYDILYLLCSCNETIADGFQKYVEEAVYCETQ